MSRCFNRNKPLGCGNQVSPVSKNARGAEGTRVIKRKIQEKAQLVLAGRGDKNQQSRWLGYQYCTSVESRNAQPQPFSLSELEKTKIRELLA